MDITPLPPGTGTPRKGRPAPSGTPRRGVRPAAAATPPGEGGTVTFFEIVHAVCWKNKRIKHVNHSFVLFPCLFVCRARDRRTDRAATIQVRPVDEQTVELSNTARQSRKLQSEQKAKNSRIFRCKFVSSLQRKKTLHEGRKKFEQKGVFFAKGEKHANERAIFF